VKARADPVSRDRIPAADFSRQQFINVWTKILTGILI